MVFDILWHPGLCDIEQAENRLKRDHIVPKIVKALDVIRKELPRYYHCNTHCGAWHPADTGQSCEFPEACFTHDEVDAKHGVYGWIAVDQSEVES